jgi:expansin (peptidoglycan-binding protein)
MSRTLSLFTVVVLALSALSSAAPIDTNSIARIENNVAQPVITLEKRKKHSNKKSKKSKNQKKAAKQSSSSSSSNSGDFTGTATWFKPATEGGPQGACGPDENDNSLIVALNAPQYGSMSQKSKWCGKKITITGPAGTAEATVNDACPGCSFGDLDLTPALFKKIVGDMTKGVGKITWSEV